MCSVNSPPFKFIISPEICHHSPVNSLYYCVSWEKTDIAMEMLEFKCFFFFFPAEMLMVGNTIEMLFMNFNELGEPKEGRV